MADSEHPKLGRILWHDLTVDDPGPLRPFYKAVAGWETRPHPMPEWDDYDVLASDPRAGAASGEVAPECVAGLCHARGSNANIPPVWLMYVQVDDAVAAARAAQDHGGTVLDGPRSMGGGTFAVIRDPAGAIFAVFSS